MSTGPDSSGRHRWDDRESPEADAMAEVFNRFTLDSGRRGRRRKRARDEPEPQESAPPTPEPPWPSSEPVDPPALAATREQANRQESEAAATYIRPYTWTGGRTRSNHRLELETLVSTSESGPPGRLQRLEHHSVAELCQHPRSVAEIAALLNVPLGVAKVLLGDMADLGLITVHRTVSENGSKRHLLLMGRVLSGLRRL
ncbi:DUF742 domain-containing protein [Saccharopolyspora pogona]|uniref:DUF742 domain-containing protein n=1 Tax=Saccharopolyspora pogona TaxID=333966 RepID=UPI001CC26FA4|nr:DUF742 domain-containing protein [Saccharopolyspora pogona]